MSDQWKCERNIIYDADTKTVTEILPDGTVITKSFDEWIKEQDAKEIAKD